MSKEFDVTHKRDKNIVGYQLVDAHTKEASKWVAVRFEDFQSGDRCVYVDIHDLEPEDA